MSSTIRIARNAVYASVLLSTGVCLAVAVHFHGRLTIEDLTRFVPYAIFVASASIFIFLALLLFGLKLDRNPISTRVEMACLLLAEMIWLSLGIYLRTSPSQDAEVECFADEAEQIPLTTGAYTTLEYQQQYRVLESFALLNTVVIALFALFLLFLIRKQSRQGKRDPWRTPITSYAWFQPVSPKFSYLRSPPTPPTKSYGPIVRLRPSSPSVSERSRARSPSPVLLPRQGLPLFRSRSQSPPPSLPPDRLDYAANLGSSPPSRPSAAQRYAKVLTTARDGIPYRSASTTPANGGASRTPSNSRREQAAALARSTSNTTAGIPTPPPDDDAFVPLPNPRRPRPSVMQQATPLDRSASATGEAHIASLQSLRRPKPSTNQQTAALGRSITTAGYMTRASPGDIFRTPSDIQRPGTSPPQLSGEHTSAGDARNRRAQQAWPPPPRSRWKPQPPTPSPESQTEFGLTRRVTDSAVQRAWVPRPPPQATSRSISRRYAPFEGSAGQTNASQRDASTSAELQRRRLFTQDKYARAASPRI